MAISLASLRQNTTLTPPRILIHGVAGVGKTTSAKSDRPAIIATEEGLGTLDVSHFPLARSLGDVMEALYALYNEPHEFGTVVIDSVDWLEPLIWKRVCDDNKWGSIEEPGYGKGYVAALDLWREYLDGQNALRNERGMTVIQIAHTDISRLYDKLEAVVLPLYYDNRTRWIWMMKEAISKIGSRFNSQHMMRRYASEAYLR